MIWLMALHLLLADPVCNIQASVNGQAIGTENPLFVRDADQLELSAPEKGYWFVFQPVLQEYDNLANGAYALTPIQYHRKLLTNDPRKKLPIHLPPGTYQIGISPKAPVRTAFHSHSPLHKSLPNVIQIVIREDDSYVGYLTELLGLPFLLPPKHTGNYGHQTDLRVGTDCAELAIYGRRRMGQPVPYLGPRGILDYVEETEQLARGTLIHYGFQVSVLYEDRGESGKLDGEDLLIHAYEDRVAIERLGDLELMKKGYRLYRWKGE